MEAPSHGAPWPVPAKPLRAASPTRPSRRGRHLVLVLATGATLSLAGGMVWEPSAPLVETLGQLLELDVLWRVCASGLVYAVWVLAILGAHEMGHYLACRHYGIPATLPFFLPGLPPIGSFGAVIRIRGPIPHRRALFDIAAAGPLAGFAVAVPVLVIGVARAQPFIATPGLDSASAVKLGEPVLLTLLQRLMREPGELAVNAWIGAGWVGLLVTSLNLFPVGQLDGGHAVYALSRRAHRLLARTTLVVLGAVIATQWVVFRQFPFYVLWFAILLWMRDRHPRVLDESTPLGATRTAVLGLLGILFACSFILVPVYIE